MRNLEDALVPCRANPESILHLSTESCPPVEDILRPTQHDIGSFLPTELVNLCFRLLDFSDRVVVSHVSRAWRSIALSDPILWNTTVMLCRDRRANARMLRTLLDRSDPLPFSLTLATSFAFPSLPRKIFHVLFISMDRIQRLALFSIPAQIIRRVFEYDAPVLRILGWGFSGQACALPTHWGKERAPLLQDLCLKSFYVPRNMQPLEALRSFTGQLGSVSAARMSISSMFPVLEVLDLEFITQDALQYLEELPQTLKSISLSLEPGLSVGVAIDYAPLIRACKGLHIQRLSIEGALEFLDALQLFSSVSRGTWKLLISAYYDNSISASACSGSVQYTIRCHRPVSISHRFLLAIHLDKLSCLSISAALLLQLRDLEWWGHALPELCSIEIHFRDDSLTQDALLPITQASQPILSPRLASIHLFIYSASEGAYRSILVHFPSLLRGLLSYTSPQLEDISIIAYDDRCTEWSDVIALMSLAKCVRVKGLHRTKEFTLANSEQFVSSL